MTINDVLERLDAIVARCPDQPIGTMMDVDVAMQANEFINEVDTLLKAMKREQMLGFLDK